MKSLFTLLLTGLTLSLIANTNPKPQEVKKVDLQNSSITWVGKKVTGSHTGTIQLQDGSLTFEDGKLTGGTFTVDMTSIKCTDLQGGGAAKLEGHLKSDDFFGVENYPTANFEITKVVSRGTPGSYKVIGNITIKGKTKEIKFLADVNESNTMASITLDRTDFDVRYGSGSFFDNLGDKTIYDEFSLDVNLKY